MERHKTEAMAAKHWRARKRISLSNVKEENYESDTRDETNSDKVGNDKYPQQLWEKGLKEATSNQGYLYYPINYDRLKCHYVKVGSV